MGAARAPQGFDLLVIVDQREDGGEREAVFSLKNAEGRHGTADGVHRHVVVEDEQGGGGATVTFLRLFRAARLNDFMRQFVEIEGQHLPVGRNAADHDDAQVPGRTRGLRAVFRLGGSGKGTVLGAGGEVQAERNRGAFRPAFQRDVLTLGSGQFPGPDEGQRAAAKRRHSRARVRDGEEQVSGIGAFRHALGADLHGSMLGGEHGALHQQCQYSGELGTVAFVAARQVRRCEP